MNIVMTIRLEYDKNVETLSDYKRKRARLMQHIEIMQLKGLMPRGNVKWIAGIAPEATPLPPSSKALVRMPLGGICAPI